MRKGWLGQFVELLLVGDKSFADSLADQRTDNAEAVDNQSSPNGSAFELPVDAQPGQLLTLAPNQYEAEERRRAAPGLRAQSFQYHR